MEIEEDNLSLIRYSHKQINKLYTSLESNIEYLRVHDSQFNSSLI